MFDAAGAGALECDCFGYAREFGLVLEVRECECFGDGDEAFEAEGPVAGVDGGDAAVVADEVERVGGDGLGGDEAFWRFAVVRELEEVEH